jgi:microsomal dipeptidase-like Zn-dependent dipeptidase
MHFFRSILILVIGSFALATSSTAAVKGFADLHNHVFAELAHGGAWYHGTVEGDEAHALSGCEIEFDPLAIWGKHARVRIPIVSSFIGRIAGSTGDTGSHLDKVEGHPHYSGWPRWDTIAHQQNWHGHLKKAFEGGMSLMVLSAVNFEPLCELMPPENKKFADCSDTLAVERQIQAAHQFAAKNKWFKIVTTPEAARSAIAEKKLAVILSIEVTHLFGDGDWRAELDRVHSQGVRTLQLAHQLNNRFVGPAIHNPIFRALQWYVDFKARGRWYEILMPWKFGFDINNAGQNRRGLTEEGYDLTRELMKRGMLIDLAHVSEQGVRDVQKLTTPNANYPVYISHGHFRPAMDDGKYSVWEKSSPDWVLDYLRDSGGMFGLRTGPEKTKAYPNSPAPNDCQGSSKSFAQTYQYGAFGHGVSVGFASDLNGFIQQLRPRFGGPDETCGAETDSILRAQQRQSQLNPLNKSFDRTGLGNIAQLPDVLTELKNFGVNTSVLEDSSERFIRMWEKALNASKTLQ